MKLLEYKAQELFSQFDVPIMRGVVIMDAEEIESKIQNAGLTYPVVVKAQVPIGGRGKAGGIQFANNPEEAKAHCKALLHKELRGYTVNALYIVEQCVHTTEWYLSILLDRLSKRPIIIFSADGGVEIEETARTNPERIIRLEIDPLVGVQGHMTRYILSKSGIDQSYFEQMDAMLKNLYNCFLQSDCLLVEINPLAVGQENGLIALDGKVEIDDSALYRQPEMLAFRDSLQEEPLILEARKFRFLYIPVEEEGSIAVMSNGSGMLMSCIDLITKEGLHVGAALDLGGGATAERIKEAVRILFTSDKIKALLINIFGGITRCDEVAKGVQMAVEAMQEKKTIILRMEGTNKAQGLAIIADTKGDIVSTPGLEESVAALCERRAGL